jgi:hypothetical protein
MDEMSKTEGSHELDTGVVDDFEENVENGGGESQDLSDDEDEGLIWNIAYYC